MDPRNFAPDIMTWQSVCEQIHHTHLFVNALSHSYAALSQSTRYIPEILARVRNLSSLPSQSSIGTQTPPPSSHTIQSVPTQSSIGTQTSSLSDHCTLPGYAPPSLHSRGLGVNTPPQFMDSGRGRARSLRAARRQNVNPTHDRPLRAGRGYPVTS